MTPQEKFLNSIRSTFLTKIKSAATDTSDAFYRVGVPPEMIGLAIAIACAEFAGDTAVVATRNIKSPKQYLDAIHKALDSGYSTGRAFDSMNLEIIDEFA